jgi:hypothetical protein
VSVKFTAALDNTDKTKPTTAFKVNAGTAGSIEITP